MKRTVFYLFCAVSLSLPAFAQPPGQSGSHPGGGPSGNIPGRPFEINPRSRPQPQAGIGRRGSPQGVGRPTHAGTRSRPLFARRPSRSWPRRGRPAWAGSQQTPPEQPGQTRPAHPEQSQRATAALRVLRNRLAAIDRMRDRAIETGNLRLLELADTLAEKARLQHIRMTGIDPNPTPDPVPTDPPVPPPTDPPVLPPVDPDPLPDPLLPPPTDP